MMPASISFRARRLMVLICVLLAVLGATSCSRLVDYSEQAKVARAFDAWKEALIGNRISDALAYIPGHVDDYLHTLNSPAPAPGTKAPPSQSPGVDLLLRTALEKKVPPDLRATLTLSSLLQRITDRKLFNPRDVREIALGRVSITGDRASAEVYYEGVLTAVRLPFVKENGDWKIDVMAILPWAEVLMRVDRAIKDESEAQQVDRLVSKLPPL
jgi:hypothetical protein